MSPRRSEALRYVCRVSKLALGAADRHMAAMTVRNAILGLGAILACGAGTSAAGTAIAQAENAVGPRSDLDGLIEQFDAGARPTDGSVRLDAWIEAGRESDALVVVVEPRGEFKLVADPGITVTPTEQPGVEWLVPLPYRLVDPEVPYFAPPASLRLPFRAANEQPLEVLVEYAYCVVDYQCFFGEEVLTVAARY